MYFSFNFIISDSYYNMLLIRYLSSIEVTVVFGVFCYPVFSVFPLPTPHPNPSINNVSLPKPLCLKAFAIISGVFAS